MDGITILNIYMNYTKSDMAFFIFFGLILVTFVVLGFIMLMDDMITLGLVISITSILLIMCMFISHPQIKHIQATIDSSVSWIELTSKYEVIKADGQIITMIEKKKNNEQNNNP